MCNNTNEIQREMRKKKEAQRMEVVQTEVNEYEKRRQLGSRTQYNHPHILEAFTTEVLCKTTGKLKCNTQYLPHMIL